MVSSHGTLPGGGCFLLCNSGLLWVWFPTGHVAEGKVPGRGSGKSRAGLSGLQGAWAQRPDQRAKQVATVTGVIGSGGVWVAHSQASWCSLPHGDWGQMTCASSGPGARVAVPGQPPRPAEVTAEGRGHSRWLVEEREEEDEPQPPSGGEARWAPAVRGGEPGPGE